MVTATKGFGAIASPIDVRDYKASCVSNVTFPEEFEIYRPPVKDQGVVNSCVAFVLSSVVEYFNYIQEGIYKKMSTAYSYGNRNGSTFTGYGMIVSHALNNLCKYGLCADTWFPGNYEVPEAIEKFKEIVSSIPGAETYPNRISSYFSLVSENAIKANLMENGIVVIALTWYKGTRCVGGVLQMNPESGADGRHCMFIYGWNKDGWKVGNSWGRLWGSGGNCIIPYDVTLNERWGIIDKVMSNDQKDRYITELKSKLDTLQKKYEENQAALDENLQKILVQTSQINNLTAQLANLDLSNTDLKEKVEELKAQLLETQQELKKQFSESAAYKKMKEDYEKEISTYKAEIDRLNTQLLEYKKPFHSDFGQAIAKILNFFLNLFKKKED